MRFQFTAFDNDLPALRRDIRRAGGIPMRWTPTKPDQTTESIRFEVEANDPHQFMRKLKDTQSGFAIAHVRVASFFLAPSNANGGVTVPARTNFSELIREQVRTHIEAANSNGTLPNIVDIRDHIKEQTGETLAYRHIYQVAMRCYRSLKTNTPPAKRGRPTIEEQHNKEVELYDKIATLRAQHQRNPTQATQRALAALSEEVNALNARKQRERSKKAAKAAKAGKVRVIR
jgi:hypothetical protein